MGDLDVGATAESLLRAAAVAGGRVLANAPVVAGHVRPLQDALHTMGTIVYRLSRFGLAHTKFSLICERYTTRVADPLYKLAKI